MIRRDGQEGCDHEYEWGICRQPAIGKDDLHGNFCDWHSAHHRGYRGRGRFVEKCPGFVLFVKAELVIPPQPSQGGFIERALAYREPSKR